jgi:hypothetical protein
MRLTGHLEWMSASRNAYTFLEVKSEKRKHLEDLEIDDMDTVMSLLVPYTAGNFLGR